MTSAAASKLSPQVLQEMVEEPYKKSAWVGRDPNFKGKTPSDHSFDKHNEVYVNLSGALKNMKYQAMKDAAANCFKDKWMDEAYPNPHQVEMCRQRMENKHMGVFYKNLVNLRESTKYRYGDCLVDAGNDIEKAVLCIRGYLSGMDADNITL